MKKDIILAGVGGQGILSIAAAIGTAAISEGLFLKQAEVHGMSQRGGDVHSDLRISDREIASDLIPEGKADMILSVEPMESLRYLPMLASDGWLITNSNPYVNIPDYPEIDSIIGEINKVKQHIVIDANKIATDIGSKRSANMVILGAAAPFIGLKYESLEKAIGILFGRKGEDVVNINLKALNEGFAFSKKLIKN
ncbi:MAG TPA: indolepyruvate oxidoreductase subunit beta [Bacteroidales bacterium]|nr:indolepyruvate oxidoreductase subunit beta [Bacteroidales bacterium]HPE57146.1 indolepyruvate oxidoreductase subunit beta [Bacteroidales bacterium]HRX97703.1 indolepyruvate oxidoreductase subunit beta [Bacteroidales bacterium]